MKGTWTSIKAILFDVDGVLTNGAITIDSNGQEIKTFHVRDGQLVAYIMGKGLLLGCITGRSSHAVAHRMRQLKIPFFKMGVNDKLEAFQEFLSLHQLHPSEILYIGDDVIDLPILKRVGIAVAPADASIWIKSSIDFTTQAKGGEGVLREVFDKWISENLLADELLTIYS